MPGERSVGLVVMTEIPEIGLVAVLQERGRYNFKKMKPESWPGACQVTVYEKLEKDDQTFDQALYREAEEELGPEFAKELDFSSDSMHIVSEHQEYDNKGNGTLKKHVRTFATKLPVEVMKKIRLHPDSGGLRLITRGEVEKIVDLRGFGKKTGVPDRATIAMFIDEKSSVRTAFTHFN